MPIIKNYGFIWEQKYIYRGAGGSGNAGHLMGYHKNNKSKTADFREQIGVYVLYDENQKTVYVGKKETGTQPCFHV